MFYFLFAHSWGGGENTRRALVDPASMSDNNTPLAFIYGCIGCLTFSFYLWLFNVRGGFCSIKKWIFKNFFFYGNLMTSSTNTDIASIL